MNRNAKQWCEALRSREFPQAKQWLRKTEGYCCLGVGCELAVRVGIIKPATIDDKGIYQYPDRNGNNSSLLGPFVQEWLGLRANLGDFTITPEVKAILTKHGFDNNVVHHPSLGGLNDKGVPFHVIAEIIESNPPGLFVEESNAIITDNSDQ